MSDISQAAKSAAEWYMELPGEECAAAVEQACQRAIDAASVADKAEIARLNALVAKYGDLESQLDSYKTQWEREYKKQINDFEQEKQNWFRQHLNEESDDLRERCEFKDKEIARLKSELVEHAKGSVTFHLEAKELSDRLKLQERVAELEKEKNAMLNQLGPDPLKLNGDEREKRGNLDATKEAIDRCHWKQQPFVPDQTALVYRIDLSRLMGDYVHQKAKAELCSRLREERDQLRAEADALAEALRNVHSLLIRHHDCSLTHIRAGGFCPACHKEGKDDPAIEELYKAISAYSTGRKEE